jgi:hypothetical protein
METVTDNAYFIGKTGYWGGAGLIQLVLKMAINVPGLSGHRIWGYQVLFQLVDFTGNFKANGQIVLKTLDLVDIQPAQY